MTTLPLLAALAVAQVSVPAEPVREIAVPGMTETVVEAVLTLPKLTPTQRAQFQTLARAMGRQSREYSAGTVLTLTDGRLPRVRLGADHLRMGLTLRGSAPSVALDLLDSLLFRPTFETADVDGSRTASPGDPWSRLLRPEVAPVKLNSEAIERLRRNVLRRENVRIVVLGKTGGEAISQWRRLSAADPTPRPLPWPFERPSSDPAPPAGEPIGWRIDLPAWPSEAEGEAARWLSLTALGVGKGSTVHRLWREKQGWTYRQEGVLWSEGVLSVRLFGFRPGATAEEAEQARALVLADIDAWGSAELARARGMLRGILLTGVPFSPLSFGQATPANVANAEDRAYLSAAWWSRTGREWEPARWLEAANRVTLEELKAQAKAWVAGSTAELVRRPTLP